VSRLTRQERQRRLTVGVVVVALFAAVVALLAGDPTMRGLVIAAFDAIAHNHTVQIIVGGILVGVFAIMEIADNADKLRFLQDVLYRVLGYNRDDIVERNRDFTSIPDDYVSRAELEHMLTGALAPAPADEPKLVVLYGERDSGKTTLLHYVVPRGLSKRYRGRVVYCRGDRQSIEIGPDASEQQVRQRLAQRVFLRTIDEAEVPGDAGESISAMSKAIAEYFQREERGWLILIDQVEDGLFPYEQVLPTLLGRCNTVVVACRHESAGEAIRKSSTGEPVTRYPVGMRPFSRDEALQMLRAELRRRKKRTDRAILRALEPHLSNTSPGIIQRLCDAYQYDQARESLDSVQQVLDRTAEADDEVRSRAIAQFTIGQFTLGEQRFLTALSLLDGDSVSVAVLRAIGGRVGDASASPDALIETTVARGYVQVLDPRAPADQRRYLLTKLGRGIARAARLTLGPEAELNAGAAILDCYRSVEERRTTLDLGAELPNILGLMEWCQFEPRRLPDRDAINFTRMLKDAFYTANQWILGTQWLSYAARLAQEENLPCTLGDFYAARARLTIARGRPQSALRDIAEAQASYAQSIEHAEDDLRLQIAHDAQLRLSISYGQLQQLWLAHLEALSQRTMLLRSASSAEAHRLVQHIHDSQARLRTLEPECPERYQSMQQAIALALQVDAANAALRHGDALLREGQRRQAAQAWATAHQEIHEIRHTVRNETDPQTLEALAQVWRIEGALCRRYALHAQLLRHAYWRRRGAHCLHMSLRAARRGHARYEEARTLLEIALLAERDAGRTRMPSERAVRRAVRNPWRLALVRLLPRWHELRTAIWQLRTANAAASALGSHSVQVRCLVTLANLSLHLWNLDRDPEHVEAARRYAQSARSIVERLGSNAPQLAEHLSGLPAWIEPAPAEAAPALVAIGM
jgi:tetratricopeptide (TPR) repeat protein